MADSVGEHTFVFQLTALRAGPDVATEQVSQVLPGEPLRVEEARDGWARVRTAYDYPGWLPADALGGEPDPSWLAPRALEPLDAAQSLLGAPYLWGGMTDQGIDCSGLVHMSFRAAGRLVPRDADQQEAAGAPVAEPQPGDLISYGEPPDHVVFWLGGGRILHATQRDGINGVIDEPEPEELRLRRNAVFRL
jgi:gamma-D-glutamyl-L-lysine dipeptidyl-peptidase